MTETPKCWVGKSGRSDTSHSQGYAKDFIVQKVSASDLCDEVAESKKIPESKLKLAFVACRIENNVTVASKALSYLQTYNIRVYRVLFVCSFYTLIRALQYKEPSNR